MKMPGSSLYAYPFCSPELMKNLEKARTMEIAPDVFFIEGFAGPGGFFFSPPSGNIFVLRDGDMVLLIDTGHHGFYRKKILEVLNRLRKEGARELVLMMSHAHIDHGKNNDVIYEAGYESTRFLLPEPEFHTINVPAHELSSFQKTREFFDPLKDLVGGMKMLVGWCKQFPEYSDPKYRKVWETILAMPEAYDPDYAMEVMRVVFYDLLSPDLSSYIADRAEPLTLNSRETLVIGNEQFKGWPVGRFFAIHDGSQSPGHLSFYDPLNQLMITGDATLEINPPFIDSDYGAGLDLCRKCLRLAQQGHIRLATDSHRTSQFWPTTLAAWGVELMSPVQGWDVARGGDECVTFYQMWVDYFTTLRDEVLIAHSRIGEATVEEITNEFKKAGDKNKYMKFKMDICPPKMPSTPEMLVVRLLMEGGASRRMEGDRILFSPPPKWKFSPV